MQEKDVSENSSGTGIRLLDDTKTQWVQIKHMLEKN